MGKFFRVWIGHTQYLGHICLCKVAIISVTFQFNWKPCILPGTPGREGKQYINILSFYTGSLWRIWQDISSHLDGSKIPCPPHVHTPCQYDLMVGKLSFWAIERLQEMKPSQWLWEIFNAAFTHLSLAWGKQVLEEMKMKEKRNQWSMVRETHTHPQSQHGWRHIWIAIRLEWCPSRSLLMLYLCL